MSSDKDFHCIIIVSKACEACKRLLSSNVFKRAQWIKRLIPIIDISVLRELYPELYNKVLEVHVDNYGYTHFMIKTPILVCRELEKPIELDFRDDAELLEKIETIRTVISLMEMKSKQEYRGVGAYAKEVRETEERRGRGRRRRT